MKAVSLPRTSFLKNQSLFLLIFVILLFLYSVILTEYVAMEPRVCVCVCVCFILAIPLLGLRVSPPKPLGSHTAH